MGMIKIAWSSSNRQLCCLVSLAPDDRDATGAVPMQIYLLISMRALGLGITLICVH
jgi:hypothetical protein